MADIDELSTIFGDLGTNLPAPSTEDVESTEEVLETDVNTEEPVEEPKTEQITEEPSTEVKPEDEKTDKTEVPVVTLEVKQKDTAHIPPAVAKSLRQARRDAEKRAAEAELRAARAEARAEILAELHQKGISIEPKKVQPVEPEKSPLEQFAEEFPDEAPTTKVLLEQRQWEQTRQQEAEKALKLNQQVQRGIATARENYGKLGAGLGLDDVVGLARSFNLLTTDDLVTCQSFGERAGVMAYNMAVEAIKAANNNATIELSRRIASARAVKQPAVTNAKPNNNNNNTKPKTNQPPAPGGSPTANDAVSSVTRFIFSK